MNDSSVSRNLEELVSALRELKDRKEALEEDLKVVNKKISYYADYLLPEVMEEQGLSSFKVPKIGSITLGEKVYASVKADNRGDFFEWLRATGNDALITEQVHPQTLTAFVREQLQNGSELPDAVTFQVKKIATLRRL